MTEHSNCACPPPDPHDGNALDARIEAFVRSLMRQRFKKLDIQQSLRFVAAHMPQGTARGDDER